MTLESSYGTFSKEDKLSDAMPDIERTASAEATSPFSAKEDIAMRPLADQASEAASIRSEESYDSCQAGVKRLEAISSTWTRTSLYVAYFGIALISFATSLEGQTTTNLTIFATSAFSSHALVATVGVIQGVVLSVAKPPMSKIADVFGRLEAFSLSVFIFIIGYVQQAASDNVKTYAAAQIFYAAGSTGLQVLIQIFIADTSDLLNRALCSRLPDVPFLLNVWIGPVLAQSFLHNASWRWGYGIWAIVLPVAFVPLGFALAINQRTAIKRGIMPKSHYKGMSAFEMAKTIWYELDVVGLLLICTSFSLILIPLALTGIAGLENGRIIVMLIIGVICLAVFPLWESSKTLAPRAFFPKDLLKQRNIVVGLPIAFFYFMAFYLSVYPYFQSYLLVVQGESVSVAGRIVQTFTFTSTITGLIVSVLIKYTKRYKRFILLGSLIYVLGLALMVRYRTEGSSRATIIGTQILLGIGGGFITGPVQLGMQASATHQEVASATTVFMTVLEIGGAVGDAISGAIWANNIPEKLTRYLPPESQDQAAAIFGNVTLAAEGWPLGSPTRIAINRAYRETMEKLLTIAMYIAMPCIILSFFMKSYKLDEIDQHVKGTVVGGSQEVADRRQSMSVAAASRRSSVSTNDLDEDFEPEEAQQTTALIGKSRRNN